jgi:S1-C subfamily serine protease
MLAALVVLVATYSSCLAQDAVPLEMLQRTVFIKAGPEAGTAFAVDYRGKMYVITARHVVAGVPTHNAIIQVWQKDQWKEYTTVKTIFPSSDDVDIAIFETNEKVETPYLVTIATDEGPSLGQPVWFLGYPFGIASHFKEGSIKTLPLVNMLPFVKRGTMSAFDATKPDAAVLYIDGFNNPGFSGGPILFWSFSKHKYEITGVVMGYKEDTAKVLINGQHVDTQLLVNTGILVGYSIGHAIEAIEKNEKQSETTK